MALIGDPDNKINFLHGYPLRVDEVDGGWRVSYRDRTETAGYLDHALAQVLGIAPLSAIPLMCEVLDQGEPRASSAP